jgi:hypothetical protein
VAVVLAVQGFAHPLLAQELSTLAVVVGVLSQPHKILAVLAVVGLVLVVQVLEPQELQIQAVVAVVLQDRVQLAALGVPESSSFVTPHLYYHPLPQQEALR